MPDHVRPAPEPAARRPGPFGPVLGLTQALGTTLFLVVLWRASRVDELADPDSWASVGAWVATVFAAPTVVLSLAGALVACLRSATAAVAGTTLAVVSSGCVTAMGLWLAWSTRGSDLADLLTGPTRWQVAAVALVATVVVPWVAATLVLRRSSVRAPRADASRGLDRTHQ